MQTSLKAINTNPISRWQHPTKLKRDSLNNFLKWGSKVRFHKTKNYAFHCHFHTNESMSQVVCRGGCNAVHLSKRSSVLKGPTRGLGKCCTLQKVKSLLKSFEYLLLPISLTVELLFDEDHLIPLDYWITGIQTFQLCNVCYITAIPYVVVLHQSSSYYGIIL